jgi:ribonuclease Z
LKSITGPFTWENDEVWINIPYSAAGVSTTIILTSKFTGKIMLLDVGDGALRDLLTMGSLDFISQIEMIAISHGHFDHMGGLHSLLGFLRMMNRTEMLHILLPAGCVEAIDVIRGFRAAYNETLPFPFLYHELPDGAGFDTDFFKVSTRQVEHFGMECPKDEEVLMPALGYRVKVGGTTIAYTGDTRLCPAIEDLIRDVDLAIIEATHTEAPKSSRRVHLSESEAITVAKLAKAYLIIHRIPKIVG